MNSLTQVHLQTTSFAEYQSLRGELTDVLTDEDLAFRPTERNLTLGELCREMGEVEQSYITAFRTFRQDFEWRHPDPNIAGSIVALAGWFADLDRDLMISLEALSDDDVLSRHIQRSDFSADEFSPLPAQELDNYREALLIFYGKVSVYLRAMGRDLPGQWTVWIG